MVAITAEGHVRRDDGRLMSLSDPLTFADYLELSKILPQINPALRQGIGWPVSGGASGLGIFGPVGVVPSPGTPPTPRTPEAATFVVSPIPGVGDFTDIQSAVNALPPPGGCIVLREGDYPIAAPIELPDKPVIFHGCGAGTPGIGTTISLTGAFPAFHVPPAGITFGQQYAVRDLRLVGALLGNGARLESSVVFSFEGVDILGIDLIFDVPAAGGALCTIQGAGVFGVNSIFAGAPDVSVLEIFDTTCLTFGPTTVTGRPTCDFQNARFNSFLSNTFDLGVLSTIFQCRFASGTVTVPAGSCRLSGVAWFGPGGLVLSSPSNVVVGCLFEFTAVVVSDQFNVVDANRFVSPGGPPVMEIGIADFNAYVGNVGFGGSIIIGGSDVVASNVP